MRRSVFRSATAVAAVAATLVAMAAVPPAAVAGPVIQGPFMLQEQHEGTLDHAELIVGLKPGVDSDAPADRIEAATDVDVLAAERIGGLPAVAVDVPAAQAAEAAAALRGQPGVRYVERNHRRRLTAVTANDPSRPQQWGLDATAVPGAWQRTTGDPDLRIAVLDTGVNPVPDLAGRLLPGRDYVNGDANAADDHGHGTAVASVIAGRGNDGTGIAGACWSCLILPIKVLDDWGFGYDSAIAAAIYLAVINGASIINMSFGGPWDSQVIRDAVWLATISEVLVVAAAGNSGDTMEQYPAALPGVLAVGASSESGARYWWSSHGADWVDVAAPGCTPAPDMHGTIETFCGTSAAAPLVAGIAGLVQSYQPALTGSNVRDMLTATVDPVSGGWVEHGRVNALTAVQALTPAGYDAPTVSFDAPAASATVHGSIAVQAQAADGDGIDSVELLVNGALVGTDNTAPYSFTLDTTSLRRYSQLMLVARDTGGALAAARRAVAVDNAGPTATIGAPAAGARVRGRVPVAVALRDPAGVQRMELLVSGQVVATDATAPYAVSWLSTGVSGPTRLTIRAYDLLGNVSLTNRTVVVDHVAPAVRFASAPGNRARVRGVVHIGVGAYDRYGVRRVDLLVNGRVVGRDAAAPYTFRIDTARWPRVIRVQSRVSDRAGNVRYTGVRIWRR